MVRLKYDDIAFMLQTIELPDRLRKDLTTLLAQIAVDPRQRVISENTACDLRTCLTDYLGCGDHFDSDGNPTEEGRHIEDLIDKLLASVGARDLHPTPRA